MLSVRFKTEKPNRNVKTKSKQTKNKMAFIQSGYFFVFKKKCSIVFFLVRAKTGF